MKRDAHLVRTAVFSSHGELLDEVETQLFDSEEGTPTIEELAALNDCTLPLYFLKCSVRMLLFLLMW